MKMNSLSLELDTDSGSEVDEMTVETTDFEDELFVFVKIISVLVYL